MGSCLVELLHMELFKAADEQELHPGLELCALLQ